MALIIPVGLMLAAYLLIGDAAFRFALVIAEVVASLLTVAVIYGAVQSRRLLGAAWHRSLRYVVTLLPASATLGAEGVFLGFRCSLLASLWIIARLTRLDYTLWLIILIASDTIFTVFRRLQPPAVLVLTNSSRVASDFLLDIHRGAGIQRDRAASHRPNVY